MKRVDVMEASEQEIQEIKRLKKKQLIRGNFWMLVIFLLFVYFFESGNLFIITWIILAGLLLVLLLTLYTLLTGKLIGTKTSRRVQAFDRKYWGKKRWKRKKIVEAALYIILGSVLAYLLFTVDFNFQNQPITRSLFPFIGAWIGYNIGEVTRMKKLNGQSAIG